jgi:putative tricarboxylic transport membrane protein
MKFDDAINGLLAIVLGLGMILLARGMPPVRHIEYGPGLFPTIVGFGLIGAGIVLIVRRVIYKQGYISGWVTAGLSVDAARRSPLLSLGVVISAVIFYISFVKSLGFLPTMGLLLFITIWWFDRRYLRAVITAIVATWVIHSFFYQLMSVQLPWGILTPFAGTMTW